MEGVLIDALKTLRRTALEEIGHLVEDLSTMPLSIEEQSKIAELIEEFRASVKLGAGRIISKAHDRDSGVPVVGVMDSGSGVELDKSA